MERLPIDPSEMELRHNKDFIAKLKMIGEGGPIYDQSENDSKKDEKSPMVSRMEKNFHVITNN